VTDGQTDGLALTIARSADTYALKVAFSMPVNVAIQHITDRRHFIFTYTVNSLV